MTKGRSIVGLVLIASLLGTLGMQTLARQQRAKLIPPRRADARTAQLDSFALALVLGGLRGPLVMMIWPSIENQKSSRNLEAIDTKIELLRMLQADFDSVHIFQIWNKSYNVSVLLTSLANRYAAILDGLEYARRVDAEKPDNVNILEQMGNVYQYKLGHGPGAPGEKRYYINRLREETLLPESEQTLGAIRRTRHQRMLGDDGHILPELLTPRAPQALRELGYDGSELQFLARYDTAEMGGFPDGLSPLALAYNYFRRAGALAVNAGQTPLQVSERVLDSRSAVALKLWAEEQLARGRRLEIEAAGRQAPAERSPMELITADLPLSFATTQPAHRAQLQQAVFAYDRTKQVSEHAVEEYRRQLENSDHMFNPSTYLSHIAEVEARGELAAADRDYLKALLAESPVAQQALKQSAAEHYREAMRKTYIEALRFWVDDQTASEVYPVVTERILGKRYEKANIHEADPKAYGALLEAVKSHYQGTGQVPELAMFSEDIQEYEAMIARASQRLAQLR